MVNQIRTLFANMLNSNSLKEIRTNSTKHKTYAYRTDDEYGVCFPIEKALIVNEKFNIASLKTHCLKKDGGEGVNMLMLGCKNESLKNEFATICADFIRIGENDSIREAIMENPYDWFEKWKDLIGNRKTSLMVYDVLGELQSLIYLYSIGENPVWNSMNMGTHDIDCTNSSYEVKSTIKKKSKDVTISSPHQLEKDNNKDLFLFFCQFEESELGDSIEELKQKLISLGMDAEKLTAYLTQMNYIGGKEEYTKKYVLREMCKYKVDDSFPKLTFSSFIDGKLPDGVMYYSYTIDLSNVPFEKIK